MKVTKESETVEGYCQCGLPLHYSRQSTSSMVKRVVALAKDPFVTIRVAGKGSYRVQRHFIALHGFFPQNADEMGFERTDE